MEREGAALIAFGLPPRSRHGKPIAIPPERPFLIKLFEGLLAIGGRIAIAVPLFLLITGLLEPAWIWLVAGLFLLIVTSGEAIKLSRTGGIGELKEKLHREEGEPRGRGRPIGPDGLKRRYEMLFAMEDERRDRITGMLMWWLIIPALIYAVWAWSEPVIGWRNPLHGTQVVTMAMSTWLVLKLSRVPPYNPRRRTQVRVMLTLLVPAVLLAGLWIRHPYLRPGYPDAARVKVEQLLKKPDIPATQYHVAALVEYAHELEARGEIQRAGELLNMATMVDVTDPALQEAFGRFLGRHEPAGVDAIFYRRAADLRSGAALQVSDEPYQLDHAETLPLLAPDSPRGHSLVLVADSQTPVAVLDVVGSVLRRELGVPVYRHPQQVDLSGVQGRQDRRGNKVQLGIDQVWNAMAAQIPLPEFEPRQHLLITARDLHGSGRNYLYNAPVGPQGGLVSYHRLGKHEDPLNDRDLLDDLCKQALATTIKSLTIYPCPDPRDVTAYVNGPLQLARKGRHPLPATLTAYRFGVARWAVELGRAEERGGR